MAESTYLLIAGNGKTSNINVEALLNDYLIMLKQQKQEPIITLVYDDYPSEGQQFAANVAKEKNLQILAYLTDESKAVGLPKGTTFTVSKSPYKDASKLFAGDSKAYGFLLWDDEDPRCLDALASFSAKGIPCYDLTKGLLDITPVSGIKAQKAPKMPVEEVEVVNTPEDGSEGLLEGVEDDFEDSEEYTEEEEELMARLYDSMLEFAKVMAKMIVSEVKKSQ